MTNGYIDSASLHQVIQCFDASYSDQYPWSLQTATEVTSLLVRTEHQHIAPGLGTKGSAIVADQYDKLVDQLLTERILDRLPAFDAAAQTTALKRTKQWTGRADNLKKLSATVEALHADRANFRPWIEWSATKAWHSHSARLHGLFDTSFSRHIAKLLSLTEDEVLELHRQSLDPKSLDSLIGNRHGHRYKDFALMSRAYIASTILRGKYHDEVAKLTSLQIKHHPIRSLICSGGTRAPVSFPVSNTLSALSTMLIHGAACQKKTSDRLACWVENINRVKPLLASGREEVGPKDTDHAAIDVAARIAREAAIHMGDRRFTTLLELGLSLGVGILTHVTLSPWLALPAAAAAKVALHHERVGDKLWNAWHLRANKLKELGAGRISCGWAAPC